MKKISLTLFLILVSREILPGCLLAKPVTHERLAGEPYTEEQICSMARAFYGTVPRSEWDERVSGLNKRQTESLNFYQNILRRSLLHRVSPDQSAVARFTSHGRVVIKIIK